MQPNHKKDIEKDFLRRAVLIPAYKAKRDVAKENIVYNNNFIALNAELRKAIKLNNPEFSLEMSRHCLQIMRNVFSKENMELSLMLLNSAEDRLKLVKQPERYLEDVKRGIKLETLKKEPADAFDQYVKHQRTMLSNLSGFESPAEKQFYVSQKEMLNQALKEYKLLQQKALGIAPEKSKQKSKGLGL